MLTSLNPSPYRLQDKVCFITGAAQGIGEAIAKLFVAHGARVTICDLKDIAVNDQRGSRAEQVLQAMMRDAKSPQAHLRLGVDISDAAAVQAAVARTVQHFGRIDVLVNNAGINVFNDPLKLSAEEWRRCFAVDLEGAWHCAQAVLPYMLANGGGGIVNIASVHGHKIIPHCFPYPVAKHGLIGLTRALGIQYAAQGIRVNSISPGLIATAKAEETFAMAADPIAERQRQADLLPCKRIGTPLEVAYAALFLASDEAPFINAADIVMDGGRSQLYHE